MAALVALCLAGACRQASAQPAYGLQPGTNEFGAWASASLNHATAGYGGGELGFGRTYAVGLRYGRVLAAVPEAALVYIADLVPLATVTEIPRGESYIEDRAPAYGLGISPVGLQLAVPASSRLRLYAAGAGGFVIFNRSVPVYKSRNFNFRIEGVVGLQLAVAPSWVTTLAIGLQHLSGGTSSVPNPGLDCRVISLGLSHLGWP